MGIITLTWRTGEWVCGYTALLVHGCCIHCMVICPPWPIGTVCGREPAGYIWSLLWVVEVGLTLGMQKAWLNGNQWKLKEFRAKGPCRQKQHKFLCRVSQEEPASITAQESRCSEHQVRAEVLSVATAGPICTLWLLPLNALKYLLNQGWPARTSLNQWVWCLSCMGLGSGQNQRANAVKAKNFTGKKLPRNLQSNLYTARKRIFHKTKGKGMDLIVKLSIPFTSVLI